MYHEISAVHVDISTCTMRYQLYMYSWYLDISTCTFLQRCTPADTHRHICVCAIHTNALKTRLETCIRPIKMMQMHTGDTHLQMSLRCRDTHLQRCTLEDTSWTKMCLQHILNQDVSWFNTSWTTSWTKTHLGSRCVGRCFCLADDHRRFKPRLQVYGAT